MDFIQRNLINERNNLQVELAKAKLLIAQLSEGMQPAAARRNDVELARLQRKSKIDLGVRGPHKEGEGITPAGEGAQQRRLAQQEKAFPMAEQAQYISRLENAVIALAESMNVSPEELIEYEFKTDRSKKKLADMARAVSSGTAKPMGNGVTQTDDLGNRLALRLRATGVQGAAGSRGGIFMDKPVNQQNPRLHSVKIGAADSIEFNNPAVGSKAKEEATRDANYFGDKARRDRVIAKEKASRTFE